MPTQELTSKSKKAYLIVLKKLIATAYTQSLFHDVGGLSSVNNLNNTNCSLKCVRPYVKLSTKLDSSSKVGEK